MVKAFIYLFQKESSIARTTPPLVQVHIQLSSETLSLRFRQSLPTCPRFKIPADSYVKELRNQIKAITSASLKHQQEVNDKKKKTHLIISNFMTLFSSIIPTPHHQRKSTLSGEDPTKSPRSFTTQFHAETSLQTRSTITTHDN